MLAARLKALLPGLNAKEALETAMIHSVSGLLKEGVFHALQRFTHPIIRRLKWRWLGAGAKPNLARFRSPITVYYFWMNCPNSHAKRLKPCASRLKRGKFGLPAPAHIFAIRAGFY